MGILPRNAKKIEVTFLIDTSAHKAGSTVVVGKTEYGNWSDGQFSYFVGMLRNPEICKVKVIG